MSRLYTLSILLACACGARLADPPADPPADSLYPFDEQAVTDPSIDPVARAIAATEAAATDAPTEAEAAPSDATPPSDPVEVASWELRRGETLAHFARWSELPIETVAAASGLSPLDDQLPVGTVVRVPWSEGVEERVARRREAHHLRRVEGWLASRGGAIGVTFHTVTTGETAWTVAHDNGELPVWLVETYNPSVDLDHLRPGQELMLPELPDPVVAEIEPIE